MKRHILIPITLLLLVSCFSGCGKTNDTPSTDTSDVQSSGFTNETIEPGTEVLLSDFGYQVNEKTHEVSIGYRGTSPDVVVPAEYKGYPVTEIIEEGFTYAKDTLRSVKLPDTIKVISREAFKDCALLSEINLPEGLTQIWDKAFSGCTSLKHIKIPTTLTEVVNAPFDQTGIETIEFTEGIVSIPAFITYGTKVKEITLPSTVKVIEDGGLAQADYLEKITLNEGLEEIGDSAFMGNPRLKEIVIPKSVKKCSEMALFRSELEKITFEGNAPEEFQQEMEKFNTYDTGNVDVIIFYHADAAGFTSPVWNGYMTQKIGSESEMKHEADFGYMENDENGITILRYFGNASELVIPDTIDGKPVTQIGQFAFFGKKSITSLSMPDTVIDIDTRAFGCLSALKKIKLSNNVKVIGEGAFYYCVALPEIVLPESVESLEGYALYGCGSLTSVNIPKGLTVLNDAVLARTALETIEIPEGVITIGDYALYSGIFTTVTIPDSVEEIGKGAFMWNRSLKSVTFGKNLKTIGGEAFRQCQALEEITFRGGLETIGEYAFHETNLGDVVLPDSVKEIQENAFSCSHLKSIVLGKELTTIGFYAFSECNFVEIIIPAKVVIMSADVLEGCGDLKAIKFEGNAPENFYDVKEGSYGHSFPDCTTYIHEGATGFDGEKVSYFGKTIEIW